jgi:hypothetical protein
MKKCAQKNLKIFVGMSDVNSRPSTTTTQTKRKHDNISNEDQHQKTPKTTIDSVENLCHRLEGLRQSADLLDQLIDQWCSPSLHS